MSAPLTKSIIAGAVTILKPRPVLEIWEWAEARIVLTHKVTARPGPLRFDNNSYQIGPRSPLWAYKRYTEVIVIWPTQVGKTLLMQVIVAYDIAVQPGPMMIVYPDKVVAERRSKRHIRPLIEDSLPQYLTGRRDDMTKLEFTLINCAILMAWSGSPSILASEPVKYLFQDEIAKHAASRKEDADSVSLARRRTGSFGEFARVYACTTPKTPIMPGWTEYEKSTKDRFFVRCHACMQAQTMYFGDIDYKAHHQATGEGAPPNPPERGGVKWIPHSGSTLEETAATAYYECQHCGAHWTDTQVNDAVAAATRESIAADAEGMPPAPANEPGDPDTQRLVGWRPTHPERSRYGCHIVSWASPSTRLRDIVQRWLESYADPDKRRDFVNSDLAIPFIEQLPGLEDAAIRAHILAGYTGKLVPEGVACLILTVDIMDDHFRYRIRAWAPDLTSWGIEEGMTIANFASIEHLLTKTYPDAVGRSWHIGGALIDAGYRTKEVYTFCARYPGRCWPIIGRQNIREIFTLRNHPVGADPASGLAMPSMITLITYHQDRWRDDMMARLAITADAPGAWHLEEGIGDGYCYQMRSEVKRRTKLNNGRYREEWVTLHDNHAWDTELYQLVASHVLQVASLVAPKDRPAPKPKQPQINPYTKKEIGA